VANRVRRALRLGAHRLALGDAAGAVGPLAVGAWARVVASEYLQAEQALADGDEDAGKWADMASRCNDPDCSAMDLYSAMEDADLDISEGVPGYGYDIDDEGGLAAIGALRTKSHSARASEPGPTARDQRSSDPTW
jgi:hypothetical protein